LIAASIAVIQATAAKSHPYPYVMAASAAIIFVCAIVVVSIGPEKRGVTFGAVLPE
jgi:hypothetical protein